MAKYKIGGIPVELDNANAGVPLIHPNRTVFVQKLTDKPSRTDLDIVEGLESIDDVFKHYKPSVKVEFKDANGKTKKEEIAFENKGNFGAKGLVEQSEFLKAAQREDAILAELIKNVKSDKFLQKALANAETKQAFINGLKAMLQTLQDNE